MIQWRKYDPENPPQEWVIHLVWTVCTSRDMVTTAYYKNGWNECRNDRKLQDITHFAECNLPREEEA